MSALQTYSYTCASLFWLKQRQMVQAGYEVEHATLSCNRSKCMPLFQPAISGCNCYSILKMSESSVHAPLRFLIDHDPWAFSVFDQAFAQRLKAHFSSPTPSYLGVLSGDEKTRGVFQESLYPQRQLLCVDI